MRSGRCDSSPREPADSKPANDRKPNVDASATVPSVVPCGNCSQSAFTPCPRGPSPLASFATTIPISTRISATAPISKTRSDRAAVRTSRDASSQISAHATSASGSQAAWAEMPALSRSARPKTAAAEIDTAGNTRYVPSSAQPATKPARGPSTAPTNP
jgi:hypothetical protein